MSTKKLDCFLYMDLSFSTSTSTNKVMIGTFIKYFIDINYILQHINF